MPELALDLTDRKLLGLLQLSFPLTRHPYADLGVLLGITAEEVINRIRGLKEQRIVRQISPVLDARKLGYQSTLVAIKIAAEKLEQAEIVLSEHPGISHGYHREHEYNLWITLSESREADINAELKKIQAVTGAEGIFALPALKIFKLRAYFGMDTDIEAPLAGQTISEPVVLSNKDRAIINILQADLPLTLTPFDRFAEQLNMNVTDFLEGCRGLLERGIIRRYGASVNQRKAGYKANAMTCWKAPPEILDIAGQKLAALPQVSHCYERQTNPDWQYNLFAMVHCRSYPECEEIAGRISGETGLSAPILLYSTKEFKKMRIKYAV